MYIIEVYYTYVIYMYVDVSNPTLATRVYQDMNTDYLVFQAEQPNSSIYILRDFTPNVITISCIYMMVPQTVRRIL